jgi:hypothetical protein
VVTRPSIADPRDPCHIAGLHWHAPDPNGDIPPETGTQGPFSADGVGVLLRAGVVRITGCGVWFGMVGMLFLLLDLYT